MNDPRLPPVRVIPQDADTLEQRARELARPAVDEGAESDARLTPLVTFRLGGLRCAIGASVVERALARIGAPVPVSNLGGGERAIAFVDERPVPVVDLAGTVAGAPRPVGRLAGSAAFIVATRAGPVAVAVDGPLELAEERLAETALADEGATAEGAVRIAGRLADGTTVLSAEWLVHWGAGEQA